MGSPHCAVNEKLPLDDGDALAVTVTVPEPDAVSGAVVESVREVVTSLVVVLVTLGGLERERTTLDLLSAIEWVSETLAVAVKDSEWDAVALFVSLGEFEREPI